MPQGPPPTHVVRRPSSTAFLDPGTHAQLAYRAFRMPVLDAHLLTHLRRAVEKVPQVRYAGVRRLLLDRVVRGFAYARAARDAAVDVGRQQPRSGARNF